MCSTAQLQYSDQTEQHQENSSLLALIRIGTVDAGDLGLIDNDAALGVFQCRLNTDVTYDGGADASDLSIADGNSAVGIFSSNKCTPSASVSKLISKNKESGKSKTFQ
ncbi:MAG: hypothetical protein IPL16_13080 [Ignavibacteria bacterium]|nr:hypothetical protein [Ignavibacteria bacterium]